MPLNPTIFWHLAVKICTRSESPARFSGEYPPPDAKINTDIHEESVG